MTKTPVCALWARAVPLRLIVPDTALSQSLFQSRAMNFTGWLRLAGLGSWKRWVDDEMRERNNRVLSSALTDREILSGHPGHQCDNRRTQMKAIELNMPDDVYEKLENLASHDHQSVNAFVLRKLEECARAFEDFRKLERRAHRGNRERFQAAMTKVPHAPPMPGDEL